jgi:hypothetical protein
LYSKLTGSSEARGEIVEEKGSDGGGVADIAVLGSSTGVENGDWSACGTVCELVVCISRILALKERRERGKSFHIME